MAYVLYPGSTKPVVPSLLPNYYEYEDVNEDPNLKNEIVRWYTHFTKTHWIYRGFKSLASYIVPSNDTFKYDVIASFEIFDKDAYLQLSEEELQRRLDFIIKACGVGKWLIARVLEKYVKNTGCKWWDLKKHKDTVKPLIYKKIKAEIEAAITKKLELARVKSFEK
jgi:hypothetical protein